MNFAIILPKVLLAQIPPADESVYFLIAMQLIKKSLDDLTVFKAQGCP